MARTIQWFDGFDDYGASGTGIFSATHRPEYTFKTTADAAYGRLRPMPVLGGQGLAIFESDTGSTSSNDYAMGRLYDPLPTTGMIAGMGFHYVKTPYWNARVGLAGFGSASLLHVFCLKDTTTGRLVIQNASGVAIGDSGSFLVSIGQLYHIEMQVGVHATQGFIRVYVDNVERITITDINTAGTAIHYAALGAKVGGGSGAGITTPTYFDNFYTYTETDISQYEECRLFDQRVITVFPNEDLSPQDWTLSTGANAWDLIDTIPPVDTRYIEATAPDDESKFGMATLAHSSYEVFAVASHLAAYKTDAGASTMEVQVNGESGPEISLTQDQINRYTSIHELNPLTGLPWTPSDIDSVQVSVKKLT